MIIFGCRLTVSQLPLKQWYEGSIPSARAVITNQDSGVATVGRQRLALNQKFAGSIPVSGAVAVLYWFRNLAVNQVYVGSIPIGHPMNGRHPAGRKARPPTKWEDEGEGRGRGNSLENSWR
jgi:hypothetical protein